jgi:hypothetical protein
MSINNFYPYNIFIVIYVSSMKQLEATLNNYKNIVGIKIIDAHVNIEKNKKILTNLKKRIKKGVV